MLTSGRELFCVNNFCSILLAGGLLDASANDGKGTPGAEGSRRAHMSLISLFFFKTLSGLFHREEVGEGRTRLDSSHSEAMHQSHTSKRRGEKGDTCIFNGV